MVNNHTVCIVQWCEKSLIIIIIFVTAVLQYNVLQREQYVRCIIIPLTVSWEIPDLSLFLSEMCPWLKTLE